MQSAKFILNDVALLFSKRKMSSNPTGLGDLGSGAGKGGGGGGTIREAGGSLGKFGAAKEEEYFYKQQKEQIMSLRKSLEKENCRNEEEIKRLQQAIEDNKKAICEIEKLCKKK